MTGYGKAVLELPEKKVTIEIRSLNSKTLDLNTRIPSFYREKELEIRNLISEKVQRGKIDFSMLFYGSQGNDIYSSIRLNTDFLGYYPHWNKSRVLLDAWTLENKDTNIPKVESTSSFSTSNVNSSYYIEDGSFLKLRTLLLGYTLKPAILKNISQIRIYAQASNLFSFSKFSGIDPEVGGSSSAFGITDGQYPTDETNITLGLSVTF